MPRKGKPQDSSPYDAIRGRWEAASVAQFLKLFQYKFNFSCATTQDLEEALVNTGSNLLADTFARLLRFLTGSSEILINNFEQHLKATATEPRVPGQPGSAEHSWFNFNSPEEKVVALKRLVDLCLERRGEELHDYLDQTCRPDDMRGLCAGQDAFNNVYWYLDDLRLYRENNVKKASRKDWECVCITLEDWLSFLKQFRKTNNSQERELYQYLNLELFPLIENQLRGAGSKRGQLPGNDKLVQEEAKDVAAMLKEGQQDKAKACSETAAVESSGSLPKEEAAVVNGEDRVPVSEASGNSSTPGSDTLANGGGPASAPPPSDTGQPSDNSQIEGKGSSSEGTLSENSLVSVANIKTEENSNSNQEFTGDTTGSCVGSGPGVPPIGMGAIGTGAQSAPPPGSADGGQPLPSNVLPKQPPAEAQYMQQQSQIFVFSTNLANKAAESVLQGQFPTIIACHCAQPGTKKYLEKHPLKLAQFSRQQQNPQWLNSFNQLKQQPPQQHKTSTSSASSPIPAAAPQSNAQSGPPSVGPPTKGMAPNNMMPDIGMANWNQQGGNPMVPPQPSACQVHSPIKSCDSPMIGSAPVAQGSPGSQTTPMHHSPMMGPGVGSPNPISQALIGSQPSLMGVKVPDENLTPQQRQHREEQLASLRKIQQLLFPEQQPGTGSASGSPGQMPPGGPNADIPMMGGYPGLIPPHKNNMGNMMSHQTPTSVAAQMEWHKLQHQFYEDKGKKKGGRGRGQQQSQASQQGPPPPYHQSATRSASVPVALTSPGTPNSPGNAAGSLGTSTLSLPSPRAASGLNSPGGFVQQQTMGSQQQRCLAGPSPGGTTGMDSPNSRGTLNISNPGTPIATPCPGPSPGHKEEFSPVAQQNAGDGMFGARTLQSFAHQKQQLTGPPKEPNLMPVPSPQQIQYLNTFEGQELTIQKQPNTSIRESDIMSPTLPSGSGNLDTTTGTDPRVSGPNTPLTPSYTGPQTPHTPGGGDVGRFSVIPGSPHTPGGPASQQSAEKSKLDPGRFPPNSPGGPRFSGSVPPTTPLPPSPGPSNTNFPKHQNFPSEVQSPPKLSPGSNPNFQPDNIPLNPNSSTASATNTSNKSSSHFDPITSMAQMSQQLTNNNSPGQPNSGNMMGMNAPQNLGVSGPMPVMGPFGSPMHNPHHHHHHHHHPIDGMMGLGPGGPGMPQSMPGMPMQQPGMPQGGQGPGQPGSYQGPHVGGPVPPGMCSGPGGTPPMITSVSQQSPSPKPPGMSGPPGIGMSGPPGMMMMQPQPPRGSPPVQGPGQAYPGMPMGPQQRMMLNRPPYNGANVQVKASAPNTIQYLPARPQLSNQRPQGPLNIDFLRFASPLANLDNKVPTHNLQYFPANNGQGNVNSNVNMGGPNVPMSMGGPPNSQHMGPSVSGNMNNPMGPMGSGGGLPSNGQIMGPNVPMGGMNGPTSMGGLRPPRPPSAMMRGPPSMFQQQPNIMPGGPPPQANMGPDQQVFGPPSGPNPAATMFVPGAKASPMGHAPDASQPLPPSMGQTSNFKNSPFIGPTTADPNYAQQFHNFQQQLYATNTRSQMNNNQAISQNQQYFGTK